jgi:hypothetical protein
VTAVQKRTEFTAVVERYMSTRGMSVRATARAAGYSDHTLLSKTLNGHRPPTPYLAQKLDRALAANGEIITAAQTSIPEANAARSAVPPRARTGRDPGARQAAPLAVDQGNGEDLIDVLARVQKLHRGTVHPEVVRQLQYNAEHTVDEYESLDHSVLAPALRKQRAWVEELLDDCSHPAQLQQLLGIAGITSGVLGYVAVGRGDFALARAYCLEAFQLGDFTENAGIKAWARGLQSFCEYYAGEYGKALELARDGLSYAQCGPQSVRLAINGVARAAGKLGDTEDVHRAVGDAYELMSRNDVPEGVPSSISLHCYSEAQTASNAATAYVSLAMPEQAQQYAALALPAISESDSPWSRSLVLIDLALAQARARDGDLEHATRLVLEALAISAGRPVISVRQRALEFTRDALTRWGDTPQASAVLDALSAMTAHRAGVS